MAKRDTWSEAIADLNATELAALTELKAEHRAAASEPVPGWSGTGLAGFGAAAVGCVAGAAGAITPGVVAGAVVPNACTP